MERIGLAPGTIIGGYRIISPLGSGAMGTVYKARDADGLEVAMKTLHPSVAADPQSRQRLQREIAVLGKIRHKGVARVLDAEADGDEMFIVTELVDGPTLEEAIEREGALTSQALYQLAESMYEALSAVHSAGVIHRDLKASNVLMSADGPVLIDFGIAQSVGDARVTRTGLVMGTPAYLAPELVDGADPSMATDWWSWAAMLAFAATGRPPFGARPVDAVLARARTWKPDLAGLGPRTTRALRGALNPNPEDRTPPSVVVEQLRLAYVGGDIPTDESADVVADPPAAGPNGTTVMPADPDSGVATEVLAGDVAPTVAVDPPDEAADAGGGPDSEARELVREALAEPSAPVYVRPLVPRRQLTTLAIGLPIILAAASWPGPIALVFAAIWLSCRFVGVLYDSIQSRRESRGGVGDREGMIQGMMSPWLLVRSVMGAVPALLVAGTCLVSTGGVAWWLLDNRKVVIGPEPGNGPEVYQWVVLGSVAIVIVLMWFGPLTGLTRLGARVVIRRVAPKGWPVATIWVISVVASFILWQLIIGDHAPVWAPLPEPPSLAG